MDSSTQIIPRSAKPLPTRRLLTAAAMLIGLLLVVLATYLPWFHICREVLAGSTAVTTCGPAGVGEIVPIGIWLILIVLVLLPAVVEVAIPGLLSLKLRVTGLEERVTRLSQTQNTQVETTIVANFDRLNREAERKDERLERVDAAGVGAIVAEAPAVYGQGRVISAERARAEVELISLWNELERFVPARARAGHEEPELRLALERGLPVPTVRRVLAIWLDTFEKELDAIRAARNTVVHTPQNLTDDQVRDAVALAQRVGASLYKFLKRMAAEGADA